MVTTAPAMGASEALSKTTPLGSMRIFAEIVPSPQPSICAVRMSLFEAGTIGTVTALTVVRTLGWNSVPSAVVVSLNSNSPVSGPVSVAVTCSCCWSFCDQMSTSIVSAAPGSRLQLSALMPTYSVLAKAAAWATCEYDASV